MAGFLPGPTQLYSTEHVVTMFERDSFTDLDASSSSGDEIIGLLVNEPGMNKLSGIDAVTPSYPSYLPSRTPGLNIPSGTSSTFDYFFLFFDSEIIDTICEIATAILSFTRTNIHTYIV